MMGVVDLRSLGFYKIKQEVLQGKRKYMTDREILDKYINLDNSCLTKAEKE